MMLKIQRVLLTELAVVFVLISAVVTAAVFSGFTIRFLAGGGDALGSGLIFALMPKLVPLAVSYSAPFAWLAAVALVLGRWSSDHELTALKAAGLSIGTVVAPVLAGSCVLSVALMFFNVTGVVTSYRELTASVKEHLPAFLNSLKGADRSITLSNGRLSWDWFDDESREFVGAELDRRGKDGRLEQKAIIERLRLDHVLESDDAQGLHFDLKGATLIAAPAGDVETSWTPDARFPMGRADRIAASTLFNEFFATNPFLYKPKDMVLSELLYVVDRGGVQRGSARRAEIALQGRFVFGSAPFFLGFFALAMALVLPPTGRRVRDFNLCFLPATLVWFPLLLAGQRAARSSDLGEGMARVVLWSPNFVLLALAIGLLLIARRR